MFNLTEPRCVLSADIGVLIFTSVSLLKPVLFHAPNADIQTVLSKKWLAVENQVWHAPVARFLKRLLIVADGDLTLQAHTHLYGLIVMLSSSHSPYTLRVASSASISGTYVSNAPVTEQINGTATLSTPLLKALQENTVLAKIIPIPGTSYDHD